jgi:hypothetical protein
MGRDGKDGMRIAYLTLARIMNKFFTVAPKPSALTALPLTRAPRRAVQHACGALGRAPGQDGVFDASLQKPMHNPG